MDGSVEQVSSQELKQQIARLKEENDTLKKELVIKKVIAEISQIQVKTVDIETIYREIHSLISDVIQIDNFYIVLVADGLIEIPFIIDQNDQLSPELLNESSNPGLRKGLTGYALKSKRVLVLSEAEIQTLIDKEEIIVLGSLPKQWMFLPFHSSNIEGGIVVQSYTKKNSYSHNDMSLLAYITMHIGNFLSAHQSNEKIKQQYEELKSAQNQLLQSEKMASVGQLAAGVAHEINNPLGYINSNLNSLKGYIDDMGLFIKDVDKVVEESSKENNALEKLYAKQKETHDVEFILEDVNELISECIFGMDKVKKIVQSLKNFSHAGEKNKQRTDINQCIDDTIRIVWNELKYHCELKKDYSELPETYCFPSQLNQVFMNLLVNAGHAIKENGLITITTKTDGEIIYIEIRDNGSGIDEEHLSQIFNPFFTTKPVGKGTGLGLSISYGIIENHGGTIEIESEVGVGTCFKIKLPVILEDGDLNEPDD